MEDQDQATQTISESEPIIVVEVEPEEKIPYPEAVFVNNNGIDEKAEILSITGDLASLRVQGAHPNDVSIKKNIPKGGPGQKLTYYEA